MLKPKPANIVRGKWWDAGPRLVSGCTPVSEGCRRCWSLAMEQRFAKGDTRIVVHPEKLERILKPHTPCVWSIWNDLFHPEVPVEFIARVLSATTFMPADLYMILTKRVERLVKVWDYLLFTEEGNELVGEAREEMRPDDDPTDWDARLPNVWLGTTVEEPEQVKRLDDLLACRAAGYFVSVEPLLAELDLKLCPDPEDRLACDRDPQEDSPCACNACHSGRHWFNGMSQRAWERHCVDLVIVGGETGPGARPMDPDWARRIRDDCARTGTAFWFKQMGGRQPIPEDLLIRQWPGDAELIGAGGTERT